MAGVALNFGRKLYVVAHCTSRRVYSRAVTRPSTAPGLGVCEWSPGRLYDKSVSLIPITDEILKFVKIIRINRTPLGRHPGLKL